MDDEKSNKQTIKQQTNIMQLNNYFLQAKSAINIKANNNKYINIKNINSN